MSSSSLVLLASLMLSGPMTSSPPRPTVEVPTPRTREQIPQPWVSRAIGLGSAAIGTAAFATTVGLQALDLGGRDLCSRRRGETTCLENSAGLRAVGLLTFYGGSFTAGLMLGRARSFSDAKRGLGRPPPPRPLVLLSVPLAVFSAKAIEFTAISVNAEKTCRADPSCRQHLLRVSYSVTNVSSVGLSVGVAIIGYVIGRQTAWDRLERLSLSPSLSADGGRLTLSGRF